jgi:hypothetical protein
MRATFGVSAESVIVTRAVDAAPTDPASSIARRDVTRTAPLIEAIVP